MHNHLLPLRQSYIDRVAESRENLQQDWILQVADVEMRIFDVVVRVAGCVWVLLDSGDDVARGRASSVALLIEVEGG